MNDTSTVLDRSSRPGRIRRGAGFAGRALLYCATLIPLGIVSLVAGPLDGPRTAGWWRGLRTGLLGGTPVPPGRPGPAKILGHAAASVLLGAAALPALGMMVLFVLRGVLYGIVDQGPYTTSWGGPSRAGAWIVHFLVGVPMAVAALAALAGIAAVHQRLTRSLDGPRPAGWVIAVTLLVPLLATVLVVLWTHQL
ncbi:hypothetical protein [Actinoplanes sp. NPDC026623]|uniref:hypothetical protein n=1 Tax=Actinoplanes sp. NPDC026623 TaxID=3155610 RepID=UPI0033F90A56